MQRLLVVVYHPSILPHDLVRLRCEQMKMFTETHTKIIRTRRRRRRSSRAKSYGWKKTRNRRVVLSQVLTFHPRALRGGETLRSSGIRRRSVSSPLPHREALPIGKPIRRSEGTMRRDCCSTDSVHKNSRKQVHFLLYLYIYLRTPYVSYPLISWIG